jgi:hypothetical protein
MPVQPEDSRQAGRVAFTYPSFVSFTVARFFIVVSLEMQSVAVASDTSAWPSFSLASLFFYSPDTLPTSSTAASFS